MYDARSARLVMVKVLLPLAVWVPKSWPLVPPKSSVPSKAVAVNVWLAEMGVTRPPAGMPGPVSVSVPATVAVMTPPEVDRFSTLMLLLIGSWFIISTLVSLPRDGSNLGMLKACFQLVGVFGMENERLRVFGAVWMRGS